MTLEPDEPQLTERERELARRLLKLTRHQDWSVLEELTADYRAQMGEAVLSGSVDQVEARAKVEGAAALLHVARQLAELYDAERQEERSLRDTLGPDEEDPF